MLTILHELFPGIVPPMTDIPSSVVLLVVVLEGVVAILAYRKLRE